MSESLVHPDGDQTKVNIKVRCPHVTAHAALVRSGHGGLVLPSGGVSESGFHGKYDKPIDGTS